MIIASVSLKIRSISAPMESPLCSVAVGLLGLLTKTNPAPLAASAMAVKSSDMSLSGSASTGWPFRVA